MPTDGSDTPDGGAYRERALVSRREAALFLGVSYQTIKNMQARGDLPRIPIGTRQQVPLRALRKLAGEADDE